MPPPFKGGVSPWGAALTTGAGALGGFLQRDTEQQIAAENRALAAALQERLTRMQIEGQAARDTAANAREDAGNQTRLDLAAFTNLPAGDLPNTPEARAWYDRVKGSFAPFFEQRTQATGVTPSPAMPAPLSEEFAGAPTPPPQVTTEQITRFKGLQPASTVNAGINADVVRDRIASQERIAAEKADIQRVIATARDIESRAHAGLYKEQSLVVAKLASAAAQRAEAALMQANNSAILGGQANDARVYGIDSQNWRAQLLQQAGQQQGGNSLLQFILQGGDADTFTSALRGGAGAPADTQPPKPLPPPPVKPPSLGGGPQSGPASDLDRMILEALKRKGGGGAPPPSNPPRF